MPPVINPDPAASKALPIPAGDYFLQVTDVTSTDKEGRDLKSKKNGYDMFILEMTVVGGTYAGRVFPHWLVFIPPVKGVNNGHGMTLTALKALGYDIESGPVDVQPDDLGRRAPTVHAKVVVDPGGPNPNKPGKNYDPSNKIDRFYVQEDESPRETETEAAAPAAAAKPEPVPAAAGGAKPKAKAPWR